MFLHASISSSRHLTRTTSRSITSEVSARMLSSPHPAAFNNLEHNDDDDDLAGDEREYSLMMIVIMLAAMEGLGESSADSDTQHNKNVDLGTPSSLLDTKQATVDAVLLLLLSLARIM